MLLNNQQITEEIKKEIKIYLETNDNENITTQNLWDALKTVLRGRFIAIQAYRKKQERESESLSVVSDFCDPMNNTGHRILQARILEWVAFPFSRKSSQPRDQTQVLPYYPAIPLLGIYLEKTKIEKDTCTPMFTATLFTIARTWK